MTRSPNDSKPSKPVDRSHRLAMELRKNLRRRKAQERGRATSEDSKTSPKPSLSAPQDTVGLSPQLAAEGVGNGPRRT